MTKHETVRPITTGQRADLMATVMGAIPRDFGFDDAQCIIGAKGSFVADVRAVFNRHRSGASTGKVPHFADGETFKLTLDGDTTDPIEMVRRDGYDPSAWRHNGPMVKGEQTRRFKWVAVGYCQTFEEVQRKLESHGKIPEGQWREAVKEKFQSDGQHPRGIADSSWTAPDGFAVFPYVYSSGYSNFVWADGGFGGGWRWLVGVSE